MREIKFRAWAKPVCENGETIYEGMMIEPEYINTLHLRNFNRIMNGPTGTGVEYFVQGPLLPGLGYLEKLKSDEIELLQYTGLKDRAGKEIYEGDILRAPDSKDPMTFVVKWYNYGGTNLLGINTEAFEVIGNIYENPELLKGVEPASAGASTGEGGEWGVSED